MSKIIKICKTHGELRLTDVIKSKFNAKGERTYRCKSCMKDSHKKHYEKNRDKVLEAHKKYQEQDPRKYQDIKNASKRRNYPKNKESERKRLKIYNMKNPQIKKDRQKRFKDKETHNLTDGYVKQHLTRGSVLIAADIPKSLVEAKRAVMLLKRGIKQSKKKQKILKIKVKIGAT